MPDKRPSVENEKQYEALKKQGMSKERAARITNSPGASSRGGRKSGSGGRSSSSSQGGTTAQKKAAGRKGGRAQGRQGLGSQAQLVRPGPGSVTPSPYGWPVTERARAGRGER
jgi:hypothetical protein